MQFYFFFITNVNADVKNQIIKNLNNTENFDFNFEQNTNGKIENGHCTVKYPKKIFCEYSRSNNKILVSNGKSLVIKTRSSYYRYALDKTPLNYILDKNFLINKVNSLQERVIDGNLINYKILNKTEKNYLFRYHLDVYLKLSKYLSLNERKWLASYI